MKTISDYSIYCTEAQTKKALELGAPIEYANNFNAYLPHEMIDFVGESGKMECAQFVIPTAEQLTGWLEEQGIALDIHTYFGVNNKIHHYQYTVTDSKRVFNGEYNTRKEATLAAIDAALEYLTNNK